MHDTRRHTLKDDTSGQEQDQCESRISALRKQNKRIIKKKVKEKERNKNKNKNQKQTKYSRPHTHKHTERQYFGHEHAIRAKATAARSKTKIKTKKNKIKNKNINNKKQDIPTRVYDTLVTQTTNKAVKQRKQHTTNMQQN